jgi:8-oxo-dGTP pyrophosphatase MutT (NUDIX family)
VDLSSIQQRHGLLPDRLRADEAEHSEIVPRAAVVALLREGANGAEILFIRRAERSGDPWSGHMAFPGGRHEQDDPSLLHTALRETREEIGLDLARAGELIATLPDVPTHKTGLVVRPYVFVLRDAATFVLSDEVAEVVWTGLAPLLRGEGGGTFRYRPEDHDTTLSLPCFTVEGHVVWGLTYRMLELLFEALR